MTIPESLRVGTRKSRLALAQAGIAARAVTPLGYAPELITVETEGDALSARDPNADWVASDGQFTRGLQRALEERRVDVVVHSLKDLPTEAVEGLVIAAVLARADARDCLVAATGGGLDAIPSGGHVGTSSPRRAAQLTALRPDVMTVPLRGNVETRLRRLLAGEFHGLILAAAGLDRLGIDVPDEARLSFEIMLPAPGQGALALEVRAGDTGLRDALAGIDHRSTRIAVEAERALLREVGGGCLAPLGALGEVAGNSLRLRAAFQSGSGALARAEATGSLADRTSVVRLVASELAAAVPA